VGGRTNRAQVAFEREVLEILEQIGTHKDKEAEAITLEV
jgi:hypothetical protein